MKTSIYNLIILDESGSMSRVERATITGCNETLSTIRAAQEKFGDSQENYVSIFVFNSGGYKPSRYLVKNVPINDASDIDQQQYQPGGCTPLLDAVGSTVADLKTVTKDKELAIGNVTIITDGMENSSTMYTYEKVAKMIGELKEQGWSFNFIGANIDVLRVSRNLNIDSAMSFEQDEEGTAEMFRRERSSRMKWSRKADAELKSCENIDEPKSRSSFLSKMKEAALGYFNDADDDAELDE